MAISDNTAKTASTAAGAAGFGVGGAIGAGAAIAGVQGAIGLTNSLAGHFLGRHSAKKDAQRQLAMQRDYDAWYLDNIYKEQAEFDYEMAGRYAMNSALWDVIGLKNAGLNPILAAGGGFSGGSNYAAPSGPNGANSVVSRSDVDISDPEVAGALSAAANIGNTVANTRTADAMRAPLVGTAKADQKLKEANSVVSAATARKIDAEARHVDVSTARQMLELDNLSKSLGTKNPYVHDALLLSHGIVDKYKTSVGASNISSSVPNSAKMSASDYDKAMEAMYLERQKEIERDKIHRHRSMKPIRSFSPFYR